MSIIDAILNQDVNDTRGINEEVVAKGRNGRVHRRDQLLVRHLDGMTYVARIGGMGTDWGAYKGYNTSKPFDIYNMGTKMSENEATQIFPLMASAFDYRD